MTRRLWVIGGAAMAVGVAVATWVTGWLAPRHAPIGHTARGHQAPGQARRHSSARRALVPGASWLYPSAAYAAATGQVPPIPLEIVRLSWQPATQWAVEPVGVTTAGSPNPTLWFGEKIGSGPWHWMASTLPGP
jgi:hypothetical protein